MLAETAFVGSDDPVDEQAPPTVFIVDDDSALRKSLAWLVESVDVTAETYESAAEFLREYDAERPGCLICDIRMVGMSGLELQERLRAQGSQIPIIMLTGYGDVTTAVRAMKAGATDFLEKPVSDQILIEQIQVAIAADAAMRTGRGEQMRLGERISRLTRREQEVMTLVVDGFSSRQIAAELGVSFKTVEAHRAKVMRKMQAKSVPHLIRMSLQRA